MEFEVLSEEIQFEARRIAAAFKVAEWERVTDEFVSYKKWFSGMNGCHRVRWDLEPGNIVEICVLDVSTQSSIHARFCLTTDYSALHEHRALSPQHELMVRGLYCLGMEGQGVFPQLNHTLTEHEKLELRLSIPREFWPQKWLDEEAANG